MLKNISLLLKKAINDQDISTTELKKLFKNLDHSRLDFTNDTWFFSDQTENITRVSEELGNIDLSEVLEGTGFIYVCRIIDTKPIPYQITEYFKNFISQIQHVKNIRSVQLFLMNNIKVLDHKDDDGVYNKDLYNVIRILVPIEVPITCDNSKLAFITGNNIIIPNNSDTILFDGKITHSAYNYTGHDWKFLSVDLYENNIQKL